MLLHPARLVVLTVQSSHDDLLDEDVPVPEFLPGAVNITAREGDAAILPCAVRYLGTKQVAWRRIEGDKFLTIGAMTWATDINVSMDHSRKAGHVTTWNLIIQHARPEDSGNYECQVTSVDGQVRHIRLNVIGPPITKPVISITGKKYVDLGEKIQLLCNASGGPIIPDEIDWFKGGDKIDSTKYRHVLVDKHQSMTERSFTSQLTIEQSTLADTGDYICRSSRNDIANLKVTVLHAESPNKRRGTGPGPNMVRNPDYDNRGLRLSLYHTLITLVTAVLTLHSLNFCLYS